MSHWYQLTDRFEQTKARRLTALFDDETRATAFSAQAGDFYFD
jgi:hypothetical protein